MQLLHAVLECELGFMYRPEGQFLHMLPSTYSPALHVRILLVALQRHMRAGLQDFALVFLYLLKYIRSTPFVILM